MPLNLWQRITPQVRVIAVLLVLLAVVFTPNGRWASWLCYGLGLGVSLIIARVPWRILLSRLAIESLFLGVLLLGSLLQRGGPVVWQWGVLQITENGLLVLGSVACRASLSLLVLNLLVITTPIPVLIDALVALHTPRLLVAIILSMYRYMNLLLEEVQTMQRAAQSRNLRGSDHWHRLVIGNMIGALFIRTYTRGERIHAAMTSRGYQGIPLQEKIPPLSKSEWLFLAVVVAFCLTGQAIGNLAVGRGQ